MKLSMPRSYLFSFCCFSLNAVTPLMPLSRGRSENRVSSSLSVLLVVIKKIIRKNVIISLLKTSDRWRVLVEVLLQPRTTLLISLPRKVICSFPKNSLFSFCLVFFFTHFSLNTVWQQRMCPLAYLQTHQFYCHNYRLDALRCNVASLTWGKLIFL